MIIGFIGQRSSGKTLSMSLEGYKKYKQGYKIYSNYKLNFPHTLYDVDMLLEYAESGKYFGNTVFLIDEVHIYFDSRCSGKKRNRIFSYFLNQSSKNDLDIYYTSQFSRQVELRLRLNTEIVCKSSCKCILYSTKNSQPLIKYNYRPKPNDYKCQTFIRNETIQFNDTGDDKVRIYSFYANKFFKLYDTKEVVRMQTDIYDREKYNKDAKKLLKISEKIGKVVPKYDHEIYPDEKIPDKQRRKEQHINRIFHDKLFNEGL